MFRVAAYGKAASSTARQGLRQGGKGPVAVSLAVAASLALAARSQGHLCELSFHSIPGLGGSLGLTSNEKRALGASMGSIYLWERLLEVAWFLLVNENHSIEFLKAVDNWFLVKAIVWEFLGPGHE